jgi:hypothetical protein
MTVEQLKTILDVEEEFDGEDVGYRWRVHLKNGMSFEGLCQSPSPDGIFSMWLESVGNCRPRIHCSVEDISAVELVVTSVQ